MKGITLIELLIVLVIVGVIAALSIPDFTKTRERAFDREAQTALRLIQAGEKIYRVRAGDYYPANGVTESDLTALNANLTLDLSSSGWNFAVTGLGTNFNAVATRNGASDWGRQWSIGAATDPVCGVTTCSSCCPPL